MVVKEAGVTVAVGVMVGFTAKILDGDLEGIAVEKEASTCDRATSWLWMAGKGAMAIGEVPVHATRIAKSRTPEMISTVVLSGGLAKGAPIHRWQIRLPEGQAGPLFSRPQAA